MCESYLQGKQNSLSTMMLSKPSQMQCVNDFGGEKAFQGNEQVPKFQEMKRKTIEWPVSVPVSGSEYTRIG